MPRNRTAPSSSSSSSGGTVEARVLVDTYRWHDEYGNPDSPVHEWSRTDPHRPDTITVSQEEFDRGAAMVPRALAKASDKEAKDASEPATIPADLSELDDKELLDLAQRLGADVDQDTPRDTLVAAVAAAPGGFERPQI